MRGLVEIEAGRSLSSVSSHLLGDWAGPIKAQAAQRGSTLIEDMLAPSSPAKLAALPATVAAASATLAGFLDKEVGSPHGQTDQPFDLLA